MMTADRATLPCFSTPGFGAAQDTPGSAGRHLPNQARIVAGVRFLIAVLCDGQPRSWYCTWKGIKVYLFDFCTNVAQVCIS
jgi:hypothetical protein